MQDRIILHLDMNSYYASVEQQATPSLRGKAIGVAGKGAGERSVVVGLSIEAKKAGIRGIMSTWEAQRRYPNLLIVRAHYDRYIFTSQRIFRIMERYSPKVEIFSIDEAFADLTGHSWEEAVEIAQAIKDAIRQEIGGWLRCSIGLSYGKTLAKLASELHKPDGLTVIRPEDFATLAPQIPIEDVCGIGYRLSARLHRLGPKTLADLAAIPIATLVSIFGPHTGTWMHQISHGIDTPLVRSFHSLTQEKSISHAYTLPRDITHPEEVRGVILLLAERVGRRLRRKSLMARQVWLYVRWGQSEPAMHGGGWGKQIRLGHYLRDGYEIYETAQRLAQELPVDNSIRLVAIGVGQLQPIKQAPQPLFAPERNRDQVLGALDDINDRFGELTIHRATVSAVKQRILTLPDGRNKRLYIPEAHPFIKRPVEI